MGRSEVEPRHLTSAGRPSGPRARPSGPPGSAAASLAVVPAFDVAEAFDAHAGELLGFATAALRERAAAEDVVQEVFVRAWRARDQYGPDLGSVRTWLFAIARNAVVDAHRARLRRPQPVAPREEGAPSPADLASSSVERLSVLDALSRLSEEHRAVVVEVHLAGEPYGEVARRTGVPVGTLRSRMHYALQALRRSLDEDGGGRRAG